MQRDAFIGILAAEGFDTTVTVERPANGALELHAHPFEAKALVLGGTLSLCIDGVEQVYQAGQVFHLGANQAHSERYGPEGVTYLVGRK